MGEDDENTTGDAEAGEVPAAPEASKPVRSTATQQWLDAALAAFNRAAVDEELRRRIALRIF